MKKLYLYVVLCAIPLAVLADEWRILSGPEILQALTDKTVYYDNGTQFFFASGKTLYQVGPPSWGEWRVQGDKYCSVWPPNNIWTCYGFQVSADGERLQFIDSGGFASDGRFTK